MRRGRTKRALHLTKRALVGALIILLVLLTGVSTTADVVLDGMPRYMWWGGCAPTSAGMVMGYWNSPNHYPLYQGDASEWDPSDAAFDPDPAQGLPGGVAAMIASWDHVNEGYEAGYNTSMGMGKYSPGERDANCLADFMYCDAGYVSGAETVAAGMVAFAQWDNPATEGFKESVSATAGAYLGFLTPDLWGTFVAEIDAQRPAVVLLRDSTENDGHAVAAYGYRVVGDTKYMAVHDTWEYSLNWNPPGSEMIEGVEWWPWTPTWGASAPDAGAFGEVAYGSRGWTVDAVVTFDAESIPEPSTLAMLLVGLAAGVARRIRRHDGTSRDG